MCCNAEVCYHNEAASARYTVHKGRRERVDPVQSLVINMAINAYPIVTGGVTRQYDQNTVRLIHRSKRSLVAPEICEGKRHTQCLKAPALTMKEERTCANVKAGGEAIRSTWLSIKTGLGGGHMINLRGHDDTTSQHVLFEHARGTSKSTEHHEWKEQ